MCGIVGYIGKKEAYPILMKGLKRLKYRGYDSAGIALINDYQQLNVYKTKTPALIHNGIIDNCTVLKEKLQSKGYTFKSSIELSETLECLAPLITIMPFQLLAYHIAVCKGDGYGSTENMAKHLRLDDLRCTI